MITIWTVGHSTRSIEEFTACLIPHGIVCLIDVRHYPGSRRYPHFNRDILAAHLASLGIRYEHHVALGGRRKPRSDSINTAWRNESFRGYADYQETAAFQEAADRLLETARREPTVIMCAEAVWWRCHRSLISDFLKIRGHQVIHILSPAKSEEHRFTTAATIVDGQLSYALT